MLQSHRHSCLVCSSLSLAVMISGLCVLSLATQNQSWTKAEDPETLLCVKIHSAEWSHSIGMALNAEDCKHCKKISEVYFCPSAVRLGVMPRDPPACRPWGFFLNANLAEILAVHKLSSFLVISIGTAHLHNRCEQLVRLQASAPCSLHLNQEREDLWRSLFLWRRNK